MTLQQQADSLFERAKKNGAVLGVAVDRRGYAEYVGWVYVIDRDGLPSERWVVEVTNSQPTAIKRICEY